MATWQARQVGCIATNIFIFAVRLSRSTPIITGECYSRHHNQGHKVPELEFPSHRHTGLASYPLPYDIYILDNKFLNIGGDVIGRVDGITIW